MRILYVLPFVPWSIRVRSYNLIPRLARNHAIDLVCLSSSAADRAKLKGIDSLCATVECATHSLQRALLQVVKALPSRVPLRMAYAASAEMSKIVAGIIKSKPPDVIYVERWRGLQYVPCNCDIPVLCDPTDCMILYNKRLITRGSWWERILGAEEYLKFRKYEPALARRARLSLFCSSIDRDCLLQSDPSLSCEIVPNGVDCKRFFPKGDEESDPATIIFTGNFGYRPNVHAAEQFLRNVMPAIRRQFPQARFMGVGNLARTKLRQYDGAQGIELIDFVPDLRPYLARATVAVAPISVGVGVSNKVLEAFSVGTPVVATGLACGDLPVIDGKHLHLANDFELFGKRVVELLCDTSLRVQMAANARLLVEKNYDWDVVAAKLDGLLHRIAGSGVDGTHHSGFPVAHPGVGNLIIARTGDGAEKSVV